jgi:hypothetical protein
VSAYPLWEVTLSGIVVSLPGIIVTVWISNRSLRRSLKDHLSEVTGRQTSDIKGITDAQTAVLLSRRRRPWRRRA